METIQSRSSVLVVLIWLGMTVVFITPVLSQTTMLTLPDPQTEGRMSLEQAIAQRRSLRDFRNEALTPQQISQLLWAAQGITGEGHGRRFRAAPSAGALYPIEVYAVKADGVFLYKPDEHALEPWMSQDLRSQLSAVALNQPWVAAAPVNLVFTAVHERVTRKYGQRGVRYSLIEVGHIAENVHLQAVAMGLGSVPVGAFSDQEVRALLNLPPNQEPLYIISIGYPL